MEDNNSDVSDKLFEIKVTFGVAVVLFGYTFAKWAFVMLDYLANGVHAEANVYLLALVFPFGVPLWLVGVVLWIVALVKIGKGGGTVRSRMSVGLKVLLAMSFILVTCCAVELMVIMVFF